MVRLIVLKILGFLFIAAGALMVYCARFIASHFKMADKIECSFQDELSEEELKRYKEDRALVSVKLKGMAVLVSGIVMVIVAFR